jgi:predicted phosphatase
MNDKITIEPDIIPGYLVTGLILRDKDGNAALVELGVVRKLDLDQFFEIMHVRPEPRLEQTAGIEIAE